MWVEVDDNEHRACMLAFYPAFAVNPEASIEITFLLDLSESMSKVCDVCSNAVARRCGFGLWVCRLCGLTLLGLLQWLK